MEWQLLGANQAAAQDHRHHGCLALRLGRNLAGYGQEQKLLITGPGLRVQFADGTPIVVLEATWRSVRRGKASGSRHLR
jgi:hypothetical protein